MRTKVLTTTCKQPTEKLNKIKRTQRELAQKLGRSATPAEIALELERTERVLTTNSFSTTEGLADSNLPSSLENNQRNLPSIL